MRSTVIGGYDVGIVVGRLAEGCRLCFEGGKIVVFVTGMCHDSCFYCPVSKRRMGRDVIYVDEEPVKHLPDDIVEEALRIEARGASITGGDPLVVPWRTTGIIKALKEELGDDFHIHLYTSGRYATRRILEELDAAGLDEIRFHPTLPWLAEKIGLAVEYTSMHVGAEVPAIPGMAKALKNLALMLEELGVEFLNINELEVSESNEEALRLRGYTPGPDGRSVVGSRETALEVLEWARRSLRSLSVRFCPAIYKDAVQTRNRMRRKARGEARLYEAYTPEGTILRAEIFFSEENRALAEQMVSKGLGAIQGDMFITHPSAARQALEKLGGRGRIAEYHPTVSRLLVSASLLKT